jgi:hypothetical protein
MLLVMPSIPALHPIPVEHIKHDELRDQLDFNAVKDEETLVLDGQLKHPLLYLSIHLVAIRGWRGLLLMFASSNFLSYG